MIVAIQEWLQDRLGRTFPGDPTELAELLRDGYEISRILRSYEVISEEHLKLIERTDDVAIAFKNYANFISHWLLLVKIHVSQVDILGLIQGRTSEMYELLCKMYLELNGTTKVKKLSELRRREKLLMEEGRFKVSAVENDEGEKRRMRELYDMPFVESHDIIHWHQDRMKMLKEMCEKTRQKYKASVPEKTSVLVLGSLKRSKETQKTELKDVEEVSDVPYEKLIEERDKARKFYVNTWRNCKEITQSFKEKKMEEEKRRATNLQRQKEVITMISNSLDDTLSESVDCLVTDKLFKQSEYERQMVTKLVEVKAQKSVIMENKRLENLEVQRETEDELVQDVIMKEKNANEKRLTFEMEKERLNELHQRIFMQKMQLRRKRHLEICKDVVRDILKLVNREIEYKNEYDEAPSRRIKDNWKSLFVKSEPIDEILQPVEKIVEYEDVTEDVELEVKRQETIDAEEFKKYHLLEFPWVLPEEFEVDNDTLERGLNVLGIAVHKLLFSKYPLPPPREVPNFPNVKHAVCVDGLMENVECTIATLQKLLNKAGIKVVQIEDLIQFCLNAFHKESKVEYDDTVLIEETTEALKNDKERLKVKRKKAKSPKASKKSIKSSKKKAKKASEAIEELPKSYTKVTQTPLKYPGEEATLSTAAELGSIALEEINLGQPLTDYLLVSMFIEYLKSIDDLKGWVLVNYPLNYSQASLLEEALTGTVVPPINEFFTKIRTLIVEEERYSECVRDELAPLRVSHILPNPLQAEYHEFQTYLTAFIKIKKGKQEKVVVNEEEEPLEKLYSLQGCNYNLYYENFDFNTIKYLARLIIGDFSIPAKDSIELFGDNVKFIEQEHLFGAVDTPMSVKTGEKKKPKKGKRAKSVSTAKESRARSKSKKSRKSRSSSKSKKSKKSQSSKSKKRQSKSLGVEEKGVQMPEESDEEEEIESVPIPKVGERGYQYANIKIPERIEAALTEFWEVCENNYLEDLKQLFFIKRIILDSVLPYAKKVKNHILDFIARPDEKQELLRQFQKIFNEFDEDFRKDDELKAELHCRISEFNKKLVDISDSRMFENENLRKQLIGENWIIIQAGELCNNFITIFQLENDRSVDSLQLLNDYYTVMVTKRPTNSLIMKNQLKKIEISEILDNFNIVEEIDNYLVRSEWNAEKKVIFHYKIEETFQTALKFLEQIKEQSLKQTNEVKKLFNPVKGKKKSPKKEKKSKKSCETCFTFTEVDETVKQNKEKIFEEWLCGITGETLRLELRLNLVKNHAIDCLSDLFYGCQKGFHQSVLFIEERYRNELKSIENACRVLQCAVEKEIPIQEELILIGDDFLIEPEHLMFEDPVIIPPTPKEPTLSSQFTIQQLEYIRNVLQNFSPSGYIAQQTFLYLLQDFCVYEAPFGPVLPKSWLQLPPSKMNDVVFTLFGNNEYIYWKDFILFNSGVHFPTEEEILRLRNVFRKHDPDLTEIIMDYQFLHTEFWFDDGNPVKNLFLKMYLVSASTFNYPAFLLDISKDSNSILGFTKALEVCLGRLVCWSQSDGEAYILNLLEKRLNHEKQKLKHDKVIAEVKEIVTDIADETVHECISIIIEDLNGKEEKGTKEPNSIMKTILFDNIAHEADGTLKTIHFLSFEVILIVLMSTLAWHARVQNIEDQSLREIVETIFEKCRNVQFNNAVFAHEFLNHPEFKSIILGARKFTAIDMNALIVSLAQ